MKKYIHYILFTLAGLCLLLPIQAQNNAFKIDDELYEYYRQGLRIRTKKDVILLADTFYNAAVTKGDMKAACIALTFPIRYYMDKGDSVNLVKAVEREKTVSRQNGYLQYYYHACNNYIIFLIGKGYSFRALSEIETLKQQAMQDKSHYGFFSCLRMQGHIYTRRNDNRMSIRFYKQALKYMLKHMPEQDPSPTYRMIAQAYLGLPSDSISRALEYINMAYRTSKTDESRIAAMLTKCRILFQMNRFDEFNQLYELCMKESQEYGIIQMGTYRSVRIDKAIVDCEYERAYAMIDSLPYVLDRYTQHLSIAEKLKDYKHAYHYLRLLKNYRDSLYSSVHSSDLAEMTIALEIERIRQEAKELELKNTNLSLNNVRLELQRTQSQADLEKANAANSELLLQNRELELEQLNLELERQEAITSKELATARTRTVFTLGVIVFLLLLLLIMATYFYRRRQVIDMLKERNNALAIAHERAKETDRMKTQFIQNMTHEIRTPLNAIVGFSQLLASPDMELDDAEKKEYSSLIVKNSGLLNKLINDVLDLASLESGKYVINLAPCYCNEICRIAIASVHHHFSEEDVKLYFTSEVNDDYQIITDEKRLQQVLINFLSNAQKHTAKGEIHLHCSLSETPGKITFSVTDTGVGVPADKVDIIFNRFAKIDRFTQGTGLGLNICRTIANRLNGEVKYDTNYTDGARFLFILPLDAET